VFASFMLGDERIVKLFGLGLASAVLVDALIIRSVLVPAIMQLFGTKAWWMPEWLSKVLPNLAVEPAAHHHDATGEPAVATETE
jgi:RND superfamily putative drug exporter